MFHFLMSLCAVLFPYAPSNPGEIPLDQGSLIQIVRKESGWWYGVSLSGAQGLFPSTFVKEFIPHTIPSMILRQNGHPIPIRLIHVYDNGFSLVFVESTHSCITVSYSLLETITLHSVHTSKIPPVAPTHQNKPIPIISSAKPMPKPPMAHKPIPPSPTSKKVNSDHKNKSMERKLAEIEKKRLEREQIQQQRWNELEKKKKEMEELHKQQREEQIAKAKEQKKKNSKKALKKQKAAQIEQEKEWIAQSIKKEEEKAQVEREKRQKERKEKQKKEFAEEKIKQQATDELWAQEMMQASASIAPKKEKKRRKEKEEEDELTLLPNHFSSSSFLMDDLLALSHVS